MLRRSIGVLITAATVAAGCGSGDVDRLATDTCEVLLAHQAGEASAEVVDAEFAGIVARATELGVSIDLIEAQVQVQCFDALQDYLESSPGE